MCIFLDRINKRLALQFKSQASLHGINIPDATDSGEAIVNKLSPEQESVAEKKLAEAQKRILMGR